MTLLVLIAASEAMPYLFDFNIAEHQLGSFFYNKLMEQKMHFGAFLAISTLLKEAIDEELCKTCTHFAKDVNWKDIERFEDANKFFEKMESCLNGRKVNFDDFVTHLKSAILNSDKKKLETKTMPNGSTKATMQNGTSQQNGSLNIHAVNKLVPENGGLTNGFHAANKLVSENGTVCANGAYEKMPENTQKKNSDFMQLFLSKITGVEKKFFILLFNFLDEKTVQIQTDDSMKIRHFFMALCTSMHLLLMRFDIAVEGEMVIRYHKIFDRMGLDDAHTELHKFYGQFANAFDHYVDLPFLLTDFNARVINFPDDEINELIALHAKNSNEPEKNAAT
uniref:Uncharacterized protein n=1 Tax=Globodera rostochiensis TaxID=31243 RepID=A0A914H5E8_GLORO